MEKTDDIEKLETIKRLTSSCLSTLRPAENKNGMK
jgi:hypothetical protein